MKKLNIVKPNKQNPKFQMSPNSNLESPAYSNVVFVILNNIDVENLNLNHPQPPTPFAIGRIRESHG
jgi:hypothetical protein